MLIHENKRNDGEMATSTRGGKGGPGLSEGAMGDGKMKQGGSSGSGKGGATFFFFGRFPFFFFFSFLLSSLQGTSSPLSSKHSPPARKSPASVWLPSPGYPCFPAPLYTRSLPLLLSFFSTSPISRFTFFFLVLSFTACGSGILQAQARRLLLLGASDRLFPARRRRRKKTPTPPHSAASHPFLPHPSPPPVFHS